MEAHIVFAGEPPYGLPAIQHATAAAELGLVQVTLYAIVEGHGPRPLPIRAVMTSHEAALFACQLGQAATLAELRVVGM